VRKHFTVTLKQIAHSSFNLLLPLTDEKEKIIVESDFHNKQLLKSQTHLIPL